jgi:hypothetical protein
VRRILTLGSGYRAKSTHWEEDVSSQTFPRVKEGHEADWIRACKEGADGTPASSSFEYGGALTEMVLLGMAAIQMKDQNLYWDSKKMGFTNNAEANALINPPYREGWKL